MMHAWVVTQMAREHQQQLAELAATTRHQGGRSVAANPLAIWRRRSTHVKSGRVAETGLHLIRAGWARS